MKNMEIIYKIRRKIQTIAYDITNPTLMSKIYFRIVLKQKLSLTDPETFNAKIQYYKLYYCANNKEVIECSDKYRIREYLRRKNLLQYSIPLLGFWEKADDIEWENLPNRFVLKCNHGCAYNIICTNKENLNKEKSIKQLNKWLKEDFGKFNAEPHYSKIHRGIVCEKYLGDGKSEYLTDYKVHCFNGKPLFVLICSGRAQHSAEYVYYNLEWEKLAYSTTKSNDFEKPECFEEMIDICNQISNDFPFVRVDFYIVNQKPIIGELTFVPAGGLDDTIPRKADYEIGKMFDISGIGKES